MKPVIVLWKRERWLQNTRIIIIALIDAFC
jgi:hypothetical protein